jgi:hypothetical protein
MNIFDISVRRQSDGACQEIVCHKYKRYEVRGRRNVPKRISETRQKLMVLLLEDSAGDAELTTVCSMLKLLIRYVMRIGKRLH